MRKLAFGSILALLLMSAVAVAAPKGNSGPPTHGCDQANENDGDPYDSTCDGSASQNGNGGGNANGKPCAGCVGAADNKNPKGQFPDGSDHNNGYECDGNNGIGKGNPAHSACDPYSGTAPKTSGKINGSQTGLFLPEQEEQGISSGILAIVALLGIASFTATGLIRRRVARRTES
jgi:hypothetical protein